jgi:hypothetical protein
MNAYQGKDSRRAISQPGLMRAEIQWGDEVADSEISSQPSDLSGSAHPKETKGRGYEHKMIVLLIAQHFRAQTVPSHLTKHYKYILCP